MYLKKKLVFLIVMSRLLTFLPFIPLVGIGVVSGLFAWSEFSGKTPRQHRYHDAVRDGRLNPGTTEWDYEDLELRHGSHLNYRILQSKVE